MSQFELYYKAFLGIEIKRLVVKSQYRDQVLKEKFFYPIIVSDYNNQRICSSTPQYLKICEDAFDGSFQSLEGIVNALNANGDHLRIRKFLRYTIENLDKRYETTAIVLTEDHIRRSFFFEIKDKEGCMKRKQPLLDAKKDFVVMKEDMILSEAFVSDINAGGCNIIVNTHEDHMQQGYGKEAVKACINWCHDNDLLPIYWVEESNTSSIKLAEGLGFVLKSLEWVVSS